MASKSTIPPISLDQENGFEEQEILYALNQRKILRQDEKSATCFLLHCQKFIELVRVGALEEAIKYGRVELSRFFVMADFEDLVQDCVSLLAFEHPKESFAGYLLEESQREVVADTVNAMILATNPNAKEFQGCLHSYLERLLRQLTACCLERRSLNGDQGEAFHLHRVLNNSNATR